MRLRLKEIRVLKNIKADKIARKMGVTLASYYRYEKGQQTLSAHHVAKLAEVLGVSADYILGLTDDDGTKKPAERPAEPKPVDLKEVLKGETVQWGSITLNEEDIKEIKQYVEFVIWTKITKEE